MEFKTVAGAGAGITQNLPQGNRNRLRGFSVTLARVSSQPTGTGPCGSHAGVLLLNVVSSSRKCSTESWVCGASSPSAALPRWHLGPRSLLRG